mgnify:CR=1 FL=1
MHGAAAVSGNSIIVYTRSATDKAEANLCATTSKTLFGI